MCNSIIIVHVAILFHSQILSGNINNCSLSNIITLNRILIYTFGIQSVYFSRREEYKISKSPD